jgi:hypothetical protein
MCVIDDDILHVSVLSHRFEHIGNVATVLSLELPDEGLDEQESTVENDSAGE